jgi:nucleoside-diphosphate-sugar epimerase
MKNIGIIGLGWLGLPLARDMQKQGFTIFGTTTSLVKKYELEKEGFHVLVLNLNEDQNRSEVQEFFKTCNFAFLNIPPSKCNFQSYQSQILSAVSFFEIGTKFIFASSTSVYSENVKIALEDSQILSDYNFSSQLFLTEKALKSKLNSDLTILRFAGLFGYDRNPAKFLAGKKSLKKGNAPVNLVHLDDCVSFISSVFEHNIFGEIMNVCSSEHPSREEFYSWKCIQGNLEKPEFEIQEDNLSTKIVSNEKSKTILNFTYKFDSPFQF